jgi:signal recognition particle subunit SRP54
MPLSKLAEGLQGVLRRIQGAALVDDALLKESIRELQKTLISSDVNVKLVISLSKTIENRVKTDKIPKGASQKEHFLKIVYEELVKLVGEEQTPKIVPQKILLVGCYGHGKTTTTAKLAKFFSKRGLKTGIMTTDTWRPAAYEQLRQLGEKLGVPTYGEPANKDALAILRNGLKQFDGYDVIIVDSAGRDSLNADLIGEVKRLNDVLKADERYLVLGADMGQSAGKQAKEFNDAVGVTGVIVTRMDSSAKGGGALSACAEAHVPIAFIGTGEKVDDFEPFNGEKYVSRLLGFPDMGALMEKMRDLAKDENLEEDLMSGEFTLRTFYKQLEAQKKMGSMGKLLEQMGLSAQIPEELVEQSEAKMASFKVIMDSMTKEELNNPAVLNKSRMARIARGSGKPESDVRALIKQFELARNLMGKLQKGKRLPKGLDKLMKQFGGMR